MKSWTTPFTPFTQKDKFAQHSGCQDFSAGSRAAIVGVLDNYHRIQVGSVALAQGSEENMGLPLESYTKKVREISSWRGTKSPSSSAGDSCCPGDYMGLHGLQAVRPRLLC